MIYLDYNATAPLRPQVAARMQEVLAAPSNPSSVHRFGRAAKKIIEDARQVIAEAVSAWPNEITFTASGTEGNATALCGFPGRRILASAIEHSSVLKVHADAQKIPVTQNGIVDLAALDKMLAAGEPALVSVMLANNETGILQPIKEVSAICKKYNALLHCDAVQGLGKIAVDFGALGCDLMTISAHKCGGPVGAAALVARRDLAFAPLLAGGGQELGRRAGTENVAAIAGFAVAVRLFDFDQMKTLRGWLDAMEGGMMSSLPLAEGGEGREISPFSPPASGGTNGIIFGKNTPRLPNTSCIAMPGVGNEVQLMYFDLKGFAISAGSACSSGRIEPSHVLTAMGMSKELAGSAIRISGGWATTEKEIEVFTAAWLQTGRRLMKKAAG